MHDKYVLLLIYIYVTLFCLLYRYVALSDNEQTDYKARELKSVHVDAVGIYLKLVIHKNHVNKYNLYNQVPTVSYTINCV